MEELISFGKDFFFFFGRFGHKADFFLERKCIISLIT